MVKASLSFAAVCALCLSFNSFRKANAFPGLYASRTAGCTVPTRGYAAHGGPVENEEITFALADSGARAVEFWEPGETYGLTVSAPSGSDVHAWIHVTSGVMEATVGGEQASSCVNAWYSTGSAALHAAEWTAPASIPRGGACVVFSTSQATGATAAYSENSMEVCTEGALPGTLAPAAAPASALSPESAARAQKAADEAAAKERYRLIHGILMLVAWGLLIPFAIVEATKKADKWFLRHRAIAASGLVIALIGFIIAIALLGSEIPDDTGRNTHRLMGWVVMILGLLQPANAFFRPHAPNVSESKEKKRLIWEILHKSSGYIAVILSFVTIWYGITLGYAPLVDTASYFKAVFGIFVGIAVGRWIFALYGRFKKRDELPTANTYGPAE